MSLEIIGLIVHPFINVAAFLVILSKITKIKHTYFFVGVCFSLEIIIPFIIAFLGLFALPSLAQTLTVTGRVVDEEHIPMFGASVWVKGTKRGAVADFDGNFLDS